MITRATLLNAALIAALAFATGYVAPHPALAGFLVSLALMHTLADAIPVLLIATLAAVAIDAAIALRKRIMALAFTQPAAALTLTAAALRLGIETNFRGA